MVGCVGKLLVKLGLSRLDHLPQGLVFEDLGQPRADLLVVAQLGQVQVSVDQGLLHQILRRVGMGTQAEGGAVELVHVGGDDDGIGLGIAV